MLNLKRTAVAVALTGITGLTSSLAVAGTMGPICVPGNVTVPCERSAWDFGIQALYLQALPAGELQYYGVNTVSVPGGTNTTYLNTDPEWRWGFKLEGSYHFGTGNDVDLNWYHYQQRTTNNNTITAFLLSNPANTVNAANPNGAPVTGFASYDPRWDAVNLEFGQHVDLGVMEDIRFHAGLQYAQIQTGVLVAAQTTTVPTSTINNVSLNDSLKFSGLGPRIGADLDYDFGNGFTVYGNSAMALLIGSGSFSSYNVAVTNNVQTATGVYASSLHMMVPELEGKLGATYTYAMPQGDLALDAGWMWVEYFQSQLTTSTPSRGASNFALTGPFVGLKWVGSV